MGYTATASATRAVAGMFVVDVEVHDAADHQIFQQYFPHQVFTAGQTQRFNVSWPVPDSLAAGTYLAQVGIFDQAFQNQLFYESSAAPIIVSVVQTGLTAQVVAGSNCIQLQDTTGVTIGTLVRIGTPPDDEWRYVSGIADSCGATQASSSSGPVRAASTGDVTLDQPLVRSHPSDTQVVVQPAGSLCTPRPQVNLAPVPGALGGQLQVTVSAGRGQLLEIRFGTATNVRITVPSGAGGRPGVNGSPGDTTLTLPDKPSTLTFTVSRAVAGQATTVPMTLLDECGEWTTFVGGGAGAF